MITEVINNCVSNTGNVIVDFYTGTCAPCRALNPILEEISKTFDIRVEKVDVTKNPEISQKFGVMSVPTIAFMRNGRIRSTVVGLKDKKTLESIMKRCFSA